ncbi:MAG TPA: helix-turn-helix transcriptional regulator [Stellaceae bacterium]|nr:helix-turn-helix transcriptional regulator [Stellaceae bacterium]
MIYAQAGMAEFEVATPGFLRARRPPPYRPGPAARQVDVAIGRRLREARRGAGISLQQLGDAMGVSAETVRRYETGLRRMAPARLAAAVRFLGVPLAWFFSNGNPPAPPWR